jgi:hypothetical protein
MDGNAEFNDFGSRPDAVRLSVFDDGQSSTAWLEASQKRELGASI